MVVASAMIVPTFYAGPVLWDALKGWSQFPLIAEFKASSSLSRWYLPADNIELVRDNVAAEPRGRFYVDEHRSVILMPIVGNWTDYHSVCVEYVSSGSASVDFSVRDGLPLVSGKPRHVVRFDLSEGHHVWRVRIDDLPGGARFSPVDLSRVQSVHWFLDSLSSTPKIPVEFDVIRIWLE